MAVPEAVIHPRAVQGSPQSTHGHRRQLHKSPRHAAARLPLPLRVQHQPQDHRPQLSLARAVQRFPWHGYVAAHAHPSRLAGSASPVPPEPRQLARSFCRSHHAPWFAHGFSGTHRRTPGWIRKLLPAAADWRMRNGLPHAEPPRVLGHRGFVRRHDRRVLNLPLIGNHALDRQRRHLLCCISLQRAQFQRHHYRSPRQRNVTHAHANHPASVVAKAVPVLWQRLFWFFAQAEVYVAVLPCFGLTTHLVSTFSRKPVWKERLVVLALCGVGLIGFCVWGQHMFSSGMNPFSPLVFSLLASSLGLPAAILLLSWLGTLWNARVQLNTAMLFALGFISLFLSGGVSGIFLARHDLAAAAVSDDFVTGHFHLVMGVAATFAILGALFFWFPKLFGRRLNEPLGKLHFWITFAGVYCVFMPMHWLGLIVHSRVSSDSPLASVAAAGSSMRTFITVAILLTVFAQGLFLINFLWSLFRGDNADESNPWRATTLEWSVLSPPPPDDFGLSNPVVYRGAYEFSVPGVAEDFVPQHFAPEQSAKARESGE